MHKKPAGQTLIEVLITILIIGVGVIALLLYQNYLSYDFSVAKQRNDATALATNQIEILRDFHVIDDTTGYDSYQDIASGTSTATISNTIYTLTWTVTAFTNPTYKRIDVSVQWTDRNAGAQTVRLVSIVAGVDPLYSAIVM